MPALPRRRRAPAALVLAMAAAALGAAAVSASAASPAPAKPLEAKLDRLEGGKLKLSALVLLDRDGRVAGLRLGVTRRDALLALLAEVENSAAAGASGRQ